MHLVRHLMPLGLLLSIIIMKLRIVVWLVMTIVSLSDIPPTVIDAGTCLVYSGSIDIAGPWTDPLPETVNFNVFFPIKPTFALLLRGFGFGGETTHYGYDIEAGTLTSVSAQFSITNSSNAAFISALKFRWVASVGEHLQFFPVSLIFPVSHYGPNTVYDIPFDYRSVVRWSPGVFEVAITAVISAFQMNLDSYGHRIDMTIAKWDGASTYTYSGDSAFILNNDALYGVNCPFTVSLGVDVVKVWAGSFIGTAIHSYIIFHKIQLSGTVTTGVGIVRTHDRDFTEGPYADSIANAQSNVAITGSNVVRIYGFEYFEFTTYNPYTNIMEISTSDGVNTIGLHDTDPSMSNAQSYEFYASYSYPSSPAACPPGCLCSSGAICSGCILNEYRTAALVDVGGVPACPCLHSFYEAVDTTCQPCPQDSYCKTCNINIDNQLKCTSCQCSQHRELNYLGQCVCSQGYQEPTAPGPYCVKAM